MSAKTARRKPPTFAAACAALRRDFGLALRRKPGRRTKDAEGAYLQVIERSGLTPAQHVDALMGALTTAHPEASVLEICSWFAPGFLKRELGDHYDADARHLEIAPEESLKRWKKAGSERCDSEPRAIIQGNDPDATPIARGPAGNFGGSQQ